MATGAQPQVSMGVGDGGAGGPISLACLGKAGICVTVLASVLNLVCFYPRRWPKIWICMEDTRIFQYWLVGFKKSSVPAN